MRNIVPGACRLAMALVAGVAAMTPLSAAPYQAKRVGDWAVAASADESGCFLSRDYDEPEGTTLLLGLDIAGTNHLSVLNPDWSIKPKAQVVLDFRLSKGAYPQHAAIGIAAMGKRGFVTDFEPGFPAHFAASAFLHVRRGAVPVAELSLAGSGAAVAELRACVAAQRRLAAAGPRQQTDAPRVPKDPFAAEFDQRSRKP